MEARKAAIRSTHTSRWLNGIATLVRVLTRVRGASLLLTQVLTSRGGLNKIISRGLSSGSNRLSSRSSPQSWRKNSRLKLEVAAMERVNLTGCRRTNSHSLHEQNAGSARDLNSLHRYAHGVSRSALANGVFLSFLGWHLSGVITVTRQCI
jgi:hypothetical protein